MKAAKQTATIPVVTYSRYSSDRQRATSIEDQQRNTHARAAQEKECEWHVTIDYVDEAISGKDSTRPAYRRMLADAAAGKFKVLLLDDLSRLSRDSVEQERAMRRLEFDGIRIIATADNYDTLNPARKIQRQMKGMQNEIYSDDLAKRVHRGQMGQAIKKRWNGGRPYGYKLRKILDQSQRDQYGEPLKVGVELDVEPKQAKTVLHIFTRFADGASCRDIAAELNASATPSPGSTWKRKKRRCKGWLDTTIRGILLNPLYTGRQRWNACQFLKDPDTGKDRRRERPETEWIVNEIPRLRIISDELWARVEQRQRDASNNNARLKTGNRARYILSGLLVCDVCDANYAMGDMRSYACATHLGSKSCKATERVLRTEMERVVLAPVLDGLLDPRRVERMAKEMEAEYRQRMDSASTRRDAAPQELADLDARIARLRDRLRDGDPDLTDDELEAAIDRAESKRKQLVATQPAGRQSARILSMLPKAAALYRKQIEEGLSGDPQAVQRAKVILRDLVGPVRLAPGKKGEVWASYRLNPAALIKTGTDGRGDRI